MAPNPNDFISPIWRPDIFADTTVFCTGGAGTICSVQVKALVYLGANACVVGRNVKKTEAVAAEIATVRQGARVLGIGDVDVRDFKSVEGAVERCVRELGGVDYVIAGAAGNFLAPISSLSPNGFKSVIDIDLIGSYNTVKATIPHLIDAAANSRKSGKGTSGRIIFVSATQHYTGQPLQSHVAAAKAGVDALAVSVCIEYGRDGVTSNVIAPGPIEGTEGMARLSPSTGKTRAQEANSDGSSSPAPSSSSPPSQPSSSDITLMGIPSGRWGKTSEIADATVFLFSDGGNYINGATLVVDGGAWRATALGAAWQARGHDKAKL